MHLVPVCPAHLLFYCCMLSFWANIWWWWWWQTTPLTIAIGPISVATCRTVVRRCRVDNTWPVAVLTARSEAIGTESLPTPPPFDTPVRGGFPSEYCHAAWCGKTRMAWLPGGENFLKICLFLLTESTNVTDRQTDTQTDGRTPHDDIGRACIA